MFAIDMPRLNLIFVFKHYLELFRCRAAAKDFLRTK